MYELVEHTADLGIRLQAATLEQLLEDAGAGLFAVIAGNLEQISPRIEDTFQVKGTDPAYLLFDWVSELLYAFEGRRMLYRDLSVRLEENAGLTATARGEPFDPDRHTLAHEVKAITYHGLEARRTTSGWEGMLIVDI